MYTEEGNWDIVGNNTPIFFIRYIILRIYSSGYFIEKII